MGNRKHTSCLYRQDLIENIIRFRVVNHVTKSIRSLRGYKSSKVGEELPPLKTREQRGGMTKLHSYLRECPAVLPSLRGAQWSWPSRRWQLCSLDQLPWEGTASSGVKKCWPLQGNRKPPESTINKQEGAILSWLCRPPVFLWRPLTGGRWRS